MAYGLWPTAYRQKRGTRTRDAGPRTRDDEPGLWWQSPALVVPGRYVASHRHLRGKLHTMLEKLDHGHHVLRIYCKNLVGRMHEKFGMSLRIEVCVNRLKDLGLNKGLENLPALRDRLLAVTDRLAGVEADLLNLHVHVPLFKRLAQPIAAGRTRIPGITSSTRSPHEKI